MVRERDIIIAPKGRSFTVGCDNGTEFTNMAILHWSQNRQIGWHDIAPGKRMQNSLIESFNGSLLMNPLMRCCSHQ